MENDNDTADKATEKVTEVSPEAPSTENDAVKEEQKDCSRFSEDGMETEIENTSPELDQPQKKKKKKKKRDEQKNADSTVIANPATENTIDTDTNTKSSKDNDAESTTTGSSKIPEKRGWKSKAKKVKSTPLLAILALKICVVLPIAIYACDAIISLNVLEDQTEPLIAHMENKTDLVPYKPFIELNYRHNISGTLLEQIQKYALRRYYSLHKLNSYDKQENKKKPQKEFLQSTTSAEATIADALSNVTTGNVSVPTISTPIPTELTTGNSTLNVSSEAITQTTSGVRNVTTSILPTSVTSPSTTNQTLNTTEITTMESTEGTETLTTEAVEPTPETKDTVPSEVDNTKQNQYCYNDVYFLQQHGEFSGKYKLDWYGTKLGSLQKYQQALFFMYTVLGVIFAIMSIVLRFDVFLNEKWSSYLLLVFILYTISTSLTAHAFYLQTSKDGLRCFLCQFHGDCEDINPWNINIHGYFPTAVNWTLVAFLSLIFKAYDCFLIGCITLWFVVDLDSDPVWCTLLKVFGWMIIFPLMTFTPLFGVLAFEVLPGVGLVDTSASLAMTVLFGIGCAFWGIALILLPIFCKLRMCGNGDEESEFEEEEY